ncbi:hypothetical protein [Nonomuraea wenchangensis]|uniref:hypothetical protein n=1 Tax=Nonomuraea wenchangensis TaxID=568860 RepID=UPI003F4D9DE2
MGEQRHDRDPGGVGQGRSQSSYAYAAGGMSAAAKITANLNTHRAYASAIDRVIARLGHDRPLVEVADAEIGAALTELWRTSAPATWNRNRATDATVRSPSSTMRTASSLNSGENCLRRLVTYLPLPDCCQLM